MTGLDLRGLTIRYARELLDSKQLSSVELTDAYLSRIDETALDAQTAENATLVARAEEQQAALSRRGDELDAAVGRTASLEQQLATLPQQLATLQEQLDCQLHAARTGAGAAALGSPVTCVAWLANTLADRGRSLQKDMIVMTGSIVSTKFLNQGDEVSFAIDTLGDVRLTVS